MTEEPMAWRRIDAKNAHLLCCHCGNATLFIYGHGASELAATLTGQVICEECSLLEEREREPVRWQTGPVIG